MNGLAASSPSATTASVGACAPAGDEFDDVLGGLGLDHHDRDVIVFEHTAGDDHVEHGPLELLDGRERDPRAVDQRDTHRRRRDRRTAGPQIWVDADAALMATTSYRSLGSRLIIVTTT